MRQVDKEDFPSSSFLDFLPLFCCFKQRRGQSCFVLSLRLD
jgi:hypothetical protein